MTDRTIQLKMFLDDEDEPYLWFEWRNIDHTTFWLIEHLLEKFLGEPTDRSGD